MGVLESSDLSEIFLCAYHIILNGGNDLFSSIFDISTFFNNPNMAPSYRYLGARHDAYIEYLPIVYHTMLVGPSSNLMAPPVHKKGRSSPSKTKSSTYLYITHCSHIN